MPANCDVLLGDQAIRELGLLEPESTEMTESIDRLPEICVRQPSLGPVVRVAMDVEGTTIPEDSPTCESWWTDADMRRYLKDNPDCFPESADDWTKVAINPDLPRHVKRRNGEGVEEMP